MRGRIRRDVSAWYPMLLFKHPIFEMCFSTCRKKFIRGLSLGIPNGVHLHMLVYKRLMRWAWARGRRAS